MRFVTSGRSRIAVGNSRWSCQRSSSSTLGTRTTLHTFCSPARCRSSIVSHLWTSIRSVFARRWRRLTSMLVESTTWFRPHGPRGSGGARTHSGPPRSNSSSAYHPVAQSAAAPGQSPRAPLAISHSHASFPRPRRDALRKAELPCANSQLESQPKSRGQCGILLSMMSLLPVERFLKEHDSKQPVFPLAHLHKDLMGHELSCSGQ